MKNPIIKLITVAGCVMLFIIIFSLLMYLNMNLFNIPVDAAIGLNLFYVLAALYFITKRLK